MGIEVGSKTPVEIVRLIDGYRLWDKAELPADAFARFQQQSVLDAITRQVVSLVAGPRWGGLEAKLANVPRDELVENLDEMQEAVGTDQRQKAIADAVAHRLWQWKSVGDLVTGFDDLIRSAVQHANMADQQGVSLRLISLAANPGQLAGVDPATREKFLRGVIASPVLARAARFAVLGYKAYNEIEQSGRGI